MKPPMFTDADRPIHRGPSAVIAEVPTVPRLEVCGVNKSFPGVRALDGVSLRLMAGEVLAVIGENGAGKSTLMRIVAGVETADSGEIRLDGRPVRFRTVREALNHGVVLIHQELNLAESLSATANLFLGREIVRGGAIGWLDRRAMRRQAQALLDRVGLAVSPGAPVGDLSIGQRQLVEIARALGQDARVIIMDEPTSSLSQRETDTLFGVIRELKHAGVAVMYISHRLAEVHAVADRVVVLRDGRNAGELARSEISHEAMVRLMVGRDVRRIDRLAPPAASGAPRFEVQNLATAGVPPVSFTVAAGEVVGLAGLVGAGRTELAETIVGLRPMIGGEIRIDGQRIRIGSPAGALRAGLLLAPEDRRRHGLILTDSVQANLTMPSLDRLSVLGLIRPRAVADLARRLGERLRSKTPRLRQSVGVLSGGNQQKVVLGKWLAREPRVLILDEPTRGVDVGARGEIYQLIDDLARGGVAVLMISSDLEEILARSDRVLVMHQGRIAGSLRRDELNEEAIMRLATGGG